MGSEVGKRDEDGGCERLSGRGVTKEVGFVMELAFHISFDENSPNRVAFKRE
jgi:hypothetical protein